MLVKCCHWLPISEMERFSCCMCVLLHIQYYRRTTPVFSLSLCHRRHVLWQTAKERKCKCLRCSECWVGGVAWLQLVVARSQVQQPPHHRCAAHLSNWKSDCISLYTFQIRFARLCGHPQRLLINSESLHVYKINTKYWLCIVQSCRGRRIAWPSCWGLVNKFLTPTVLE